MGIIFGLISALADASKNVFAKYNVGKFDPFVVAWAWNFYSAIILAPLVFFKGSLHLDNIFWLAFSTATIIDVVAYILYVNAIKSTDLSLALPMLTLTPLFVLFTGSIINTEFPRLLGLIGVICIVVGAYLLNFKEGERKILGPFFAIYQNKGVFMMFLVAIMWSVTASLQKLLILRSNPYFYAGLSEVALGIIFTPLVLWRSRTDFYRSLNTKNIMRLAPIGFLNGVTVLTQMIGQSLLLVVILISLKRTSIIFSSIFGWLFFGERIKNRILPIILMVLGVILISIS